MLEVEKVKQYQEKQLEYEKSIAFNLKNDYLHRQSARFAKELNLLENTVQVRYEALTMRMITASDFALVKDYVEKLKGTLKEELSELQAEIDYYQNNISSDNIPKKFLRYDDTDELTEDMYNELIEKILVFDMGVEIEFCTSEKKEKRLY
jgi:hydroxylamine reductase (hybrid-cluster protein)